MGIDYDDPELTDSDEEYFAPSPRERRVGRFDARLLQEPITVLHHRVPLLFSAKDSASEAMRAMQSEHRGCVLITEDGTSRSRLQGIFTERDVLQRVIDGGRNPAHLTLAEVMTPDPECLDARATVAWALNKMEVGGFRHVPATEENGQPRMVVSVRDIVAYLVAAFPEEILNLPPEFGTARYRERDGA
jgi:CBS domain-containing protein